jgi:hypothetical protein
VKKRVLLFAVFALVSMAVAMTGGASYADGTGRTDPVAVPISASATTPTASAMVIPMGHLNDPSNTFWELFLRPAGAASWVLTTPPGVASNGGLVAAASPAGPLTVGFLVSADLKFSPIAQSSDEGKKWSPGELPAPLVATPDALAVGSAGTTLALVAKAGQSILTTSDDLSTWRTLATKHVLARATSTCGWQRVTAVAFEAGAQPLLGLACARAGEIGILAPADSSGVEPSRWHEVGPSLAGETGAASVLRLDSTATGALGLAQLRSASRTSLVAFWGQGSADRWSQSPPLRVPTGWTMKATGTGGPADQGVAVLLASGDQRRVEDVTGPGVGWTTLANPPPGASGISDDGSEVDAFVVTGAHLAVWAWTPGSLDWNRTATIVVPVPYGSSS